ncbi:hypothetical protein GCM10007421_16420 [Halopseudomonas oceani]|nr:hypothetical protein GCM10007421_16420 [Halopseudomonas oceani]
MFAYTYQAISDPAKLITAINRKACMLCRQIKTSPEAGRLLYRAPSIAAYPRRHGRRIPPNKVSMHNPCARQEKV